MSTWKGWQGKVLRVNLTKGECALEDLDRKIAEQFIGGRGVGTKYLCNEVDPKCNALGADNITPYTIDLSLLIPGFYDGMREAQRLMPYFEKTRPYAFATVINPTQTEIYGYPQERWGRENLAKWPDLMNQVGLPWRWTRVPVRCSSSTWPGSLSCRQGTPGRGCRRCPTRCR